MANVLGVAEVDGKGRCTIPAAVREALKLKGEARLAFVLGKDGQVCLQDAANVK